MCVCVSVCRSNVLTPLLPKLSDRFLWNFRIWLLPIRCRFPSIWIVTLTEGQGHRVNWSTYIKSNRSQYLFDRCLWIFQEILLLMLCHFSTIQTVTRGSSHIENPIPSFWSCKCVTTCPAETIRQSSLKFWEMIATDPVSLPIYLISDLDRRSRSQGHLVSLHKD